MQSVRLYEKLDIRFEDVALATEPGPDEVRVKVAFAGICGSDIHNFKTGQWISRSPSIAGHEFSGWVDEIGEGVIGLNKGDKVVGDSRYYCDKCPNCQSGAAHLCEKLGFIGEAIDGCFAEFITLPAKLVLKCDVHARLDILALAEPLAVALHAITQLNISDDDPLMILGCGPIGALTALASSCTSQRDIIVSDLNKEREALVCDMAGASAVDLAHFHQFENACNKPIRHVLDTTGNVGVISKLVADLSGCTLGLVGIGTGAFSLDPVHLVEREISLVGCHAFADELPQAIELLESNPEIFAPVIGTRIALADTASMYHSIMDGSVSGIKTLLCVHPEGQR